MAEHSGSILRALTTDGAVRVIAVDALIPALEMIRRHKLRPGGAPRLAAEGLTATALMSAHIKGEEQLSLQIQAEAPAFAFMGQVTAEGGIRARLTPNRVADTPHVDGVLLAIKSDVQRELYRGATPIKHETLQDSLARHLLQSSQVDATLRLGAAASDVGELLTAGGVLVERLPAHSDKAPISGEAFRERYAAVADADLEPLLSGLAAGSLLGEPLEVLERRPLTWRCSCSRQRILGMLTSLGLEELEDMLAEDGGAQVSCHFCGEETVVSGDELQAMIKRLKASSPAPEP